MGEVDKILAKALILRRIENAEQGNWRWIQVYNEKYAIDIDDDAKQALAKLFHEAVPEKKKESTHDGHTMDDTYCYDCQCIVDDEGDDFPRGNHRFNQAIDQTHKNIDEMFK